MWSPSRPTRVSLVTPWPSYIGTQVTATGDGEVLVRVRRDQRVLDRVALALCPRPHSRVSMRRHQAALVIAVLITSVPQSGALAQGVTSRQAAEVPGTVVGTLRTADTNEPIRADVTLERPRRSARTDSTGRFVFRDVPAGRVRLRTASFGFEPVDTTIVVVSSDTMTMTLRVRRLPQSLAPVRTIAKSPERLRFEEQAMPSVVTISGNEVRRVPAIGETDVLRSVALLPGVIARNDFSAGFNVRGGEADQNLVLLDGIPIYNPFHLGGLFGTFIDKAVSGVDVVTGAFPARYGGRLSSVIDVKSLEETRRGAHGAAEVSLLSSSVFGGGSVDDGKLSWNFAARRTYADKVVQWLRGRNDFPYHFQDAQFRGRYLLPSGGSLGLTAYVGKDLLYYIDDDVSTGGVVNGPEGPVVLDDDDETVKFDWGNRVVGLTLDQPLGGRTMLSQRLAYTGFSTHFDLTGQNIDLAQSVAELQLNGIVTHARDRHTVSFGYEAAAYRTAYREQLAIGGDPDDDEDIDFPDPLATDGDTTMRQRPAMGAVFVQDQWKPNARWLITGGLRGEYVGGAKWLGESPRLSVKYLVSPTLALSAAGGRYSQWMRAMRNEDLP